MSHVLKLFSSILQICDPVQEQCFKTIQLKSQIVYNMVANEPCRLISVNIWPTDRATELLMCDSYLGPRHTDRHCRPTWRSVCERCRHWLMSAVGRSSLSVVKVTTGRVTQPLTSLHETVWYSHWNETETAADLALRIDCRFCIVGTSDSRSMCLLDPNVITYRQKRHWLRTYLTFQSQLFVLSSFVRRRLRTTYRSAYSGNGSRPRDVTYTGNNLYDATQLWCWRTPRHAIRLPRSMAKSVTWLGLRSTPLGSRCTPRR